MAQKLLSNVIDTLKIIFDDCYEEIIQQANECKLDAILRSKLSRLHDLEVGPHGLASNQQSILTTCSKYETFIDRSRCTICFPVQQTGQDKKLSQGYDLRKAFASVCLGVLSKSCLAAQNGVNCKDDSAIPKTLKENDEDLSQEIIIGVKDQKLVTTALQFIISLGICPNLLAGIGIPLSQRTGEYDELFGATDHAALDEEFLFICTRELCKIAKNSFMGQIVFTKCLGDLFCSLIQVGFRKQKPVHNSAKCLHTSKEVPACRYEEQFEHGMKSSMIVCTHEKEWCRDELKSLMNRIYQPIVIRELLLMQGFFRVDQNSKLKNENIQKPPNWFTSVCGRLLSDRLLQKNGVMFILDALFNECRIEDRNVHMKCNIIGKLLASCPLQAISVAHYYEKISFQILDLLELNTIEENTKPLYTCVVSSCISWMMLKNLELTKHCLLDKLINTFETASFPQDNCGKHEIVFEDSVSKTVEKIHKIFIIGTDPRDHMVTYLSAFIHPIFALYCFLRNSASYLKPLLKEILLWLIQNSTKSIAEKMLNLLLFDEIKSKNEQNFWRIMSSKVTYKHGSHGGAVLVNVSDTTEHVLDHASVDIVSTESKIVGLLDLFMLLKNNELVGNFFVSLMEQLSVVLSTKQGFSPAIDFANMSEAIKAFNYKVQLVSMLAAMCDKLDKEVLVNPKQLLDFLQIILEQWIIAASIEENTENVLVDDFRTETLSMALGMLSFICSNVDKIQRDDYIRLQDFLPVLKKIVNLNRGTHIERLCNDLGVSIATHGFSEKAANYSNKNKSKGSEDEQSYNVALKQLEDPLIPVKGHALIQMSRLIDARDAQALHNSDKLLDIFMDNLAHDDTYIYLAAIQGLVSLSDSKHSIVIPHLAKEFAMFGSFSTANSGLKPEEGVDVERKKRHSPEMRMKIGEALLRATQRCGPLLPKYSQILLASLLTGVKDDDGDVRASSLSNIGDVCKLLRFSVGPCIHEILGCVSSAIQSDSNDNVRQAALLVIKLLLEGLAKDILQVIGAELKDIYRLLKLVCDSERNEIVKYHAERALGELDRIMTNLLFPEQTMQKKIQVLR